MDIKDWLKHQRQLLAAATPGPWKYEGRLSPYISDHKVRPLMDEPFMMKVSIDQYSRNLGFIASVRTEHERALMIIEKYREVFEGLADSRGTASVIAEEALAYFPETIAEESD